MSAENNSVAIAIKDLSKKFGDTVAVNHLSFDIYKGEIFGFLGPNGAGKTTTIKMICGLIPSSEGKIDFLNHQEKEVKTIIGYCPQENIYYPRLTCLEQLIFLGNLYGLSNSHSKKRALDLLLMLGLENESGKFAKNLSGGMLRRLNICLALVNDPKILFLDEPEAGLDPQSRILVRNFIKGFANEKTVVLTSHNMDEIERLAHRVAIIDYGKLLVINTTDALKNSIGEGDVLELEIEDFEETAFTEIIAFIAEKFHVIRSGNTLVIKSLHLIDKIPEIAAIIKQKGLVLKEIKLHENTLEDVFIHLTGRKLRQ